MSQNTLERIVEDVKTLTPQEQQQLRTLLNQRLHEQDVDVKLKERLLMQRLLEKGIIGNIPVPDSGEAYDRHSPIIVEGEPVSETIIQERR